jgi:hypothetical protein
MEIDYVNQMYKEDKVVSEDTYRNIQDISSHKKGLISAKKRIAKAPPPFTFSKAKAPNH